MIIQTKNISKQIIETYLPPNPVIVEAGAHIGRDTLKMIAAWPTCTIHAFEPVPELFSFLTANTKAHPTIICYPLALSTTTGTTTFFVSSGRSTATSSLLKPLENEHVRTVFTPQMVQVITLDDWACRYNIKHVDALWLDMQGSELSVLQASPKMLKTVSVIHTEVNFSQRYENTPLYPEVTTWLTTQGFTIAHTIRNNEHWGNVLFVR